MAKLPASTDVLVVGAGPTGLTLATLLRAAGLDVVVIDRSPRRGTEARASVLHSRGVEILAAAGAAGSLLDEGEPINATAYYDMGVHVGEVRFDGLDSEFPFAVGIGQDRVEAALIERLEHLRTKVRRSTVLEELHDEGATVRATTRGRDGTARELEAGWVVGCDGANSSVRSLAGLDGPELRDPGTFVLATVEVGGPLDRDLMHMFSAPEGFCVLSPLPGEVMRLTATMADGPGTPTVEELRAVLNSRGPRSDTLTIGEPSYVARYRVRREVAAEFRNGRILLAGDAAHTFSPVGGQGMNTGLHDVANLAWKLAAVVEGSAPLRLVETYDTERRSTAEDAFDRTERLGEALTVANPILRGARDVLSMVAQAIPPLRRPLQQGLAGMDAVYAAGAYTAGAVTAGPDVKGWGGPGGRLHGLPTDLIRDGRHHLVLMGEMLGAETVVEVAAVVDRYREPPVMSVVENGRPDLGAETWTAGDRPVPHPATGVLIRPDGHIGWTGELDDLSGLGGHLDRWFTRG